MSDEKGINGDVSLVETKIIAPETIQIDIKTANETVRGLNETIKVLSGKVKDLEIRENNLNDNIHRAGVKQVQDTRNEETKISVKLIDGRSKLEAERAAFESGKRASDIQAAELNRRFHDLEVREKEIVDIDKAHKKLNEERQRFDHYKFNIERDLEQANITIVEAGEQENKLEAIRSEIEGKKIKLEEDRLIIDTERGELNEQRSVIQTETEHFEGLKKWHEEKQKTQDEIKHLENLKVWYEEQKKEIENVKIRTGLEKVGTLATGN